MRKVRKSVFETNSSSVNSLAVFTQEAFDKWKDEGGYIHDVFYKDGVITAGDILSREEALDAAKKEAEKYVDSGSLKFEDSDEADDFLKEFEYENFDDVNEDEYLDVDYNDIVTPGGEELVIVNKYGYDG